MQTDKTGQSFSPEEIGSLSKAELMEAFGKDHGLLSPNALLRPIVQDAILPTAATVLGPGEIAYHAQLGRMYERHGISRPAILPRFSLSSIGANQRSNLESLGIAIADLKRDTNDLAKSLAASEDLDTSLAILDDLLERTQSGATKSSNEREGAKKGSNPSSGKSKKP